MTILDTIIESTRAEVRKRKRLASPSSGEPRLRPRELGQLRTALEAPGIGVIAEIKRRSPSAGQLRAEVDVAAIASGYAEAGASALSVLTEGPHFGGSLQDLRTARAACDLPILRKDFIVDEFQLEEAVAAGADAVLLIVAALSASQLAGLREQAEGLGLDALVEVHDRDELDIALRAGAQIVGVNNRDLRDFSVDIERTFKLLRSMPEQVIVVSESGIANAEQLKRLEQAGAHAVLVGESLMRAPDPGEALARLRGTETSAAPASSGGRMHRRRSSSQVFRTADDEL